ncbi:MAG: TetR/AcrR family transcriptional regulator [Pseudomonadota bacterium]
MVQTSNTHKDDTYENAKLGKKGQATRDMLDKAILELVNERGFTNFRLQDLCERTGLTIGAFYFHYENKDRALEAVAAKAAGDVFATIGADIADQPLEDVFRHVIMDYQRAYSHPELQEMTRMLRAMIPANSIVTETYFSARSNIIQELTQAATKDRKRAGLKPGPERAIIEYLFSGLADFFELLYLGEDKELKRSAGSEKKIAQRLAGIWYRAIMDA